MSGPRLNGLVRAELRAAWRSWLAVLVTFVATGFALALSVQLGDSMSATVATGAVGEDNAAALVFVPWWNLGLALVAGVTVIGAVTGLVVQARRGALARLALAGATPGQVTRVVLGQLAVVAATGALIGNVVAFVMLAPAARELVADRGIDPDLAVVRAAPGPVLGATALVVGAALLGGWRQARAAALIPPVAALRESQVDVRRGRHVGRWVRAVLLALVVVGIAVGIRAFAPLLGRDGGDAVLQGALIAMLVAGSALSASAPLTVGALTRAWTALVPSRSAVWVLARATVIAKGERLARTVTPVMFAIGLLFGLGALVSSIVVTLENMGRAGLEQTGVTSMLVLIGLVLLVSTSGGLSTLLMMSPQREGEVALAGVAGATPTQQVLLPVLEGAIITVTATILGLVMSAVGVGVLVLGMSAIGLPAGYRVPWGVLGAVVGVAFVLIVAATTLPILGSLRHPAREVAAQLAAE